MSFRCKYQLVLMGVVDTAVFRSAVRQDSQKPKAVLLEERQNLVVQKVSGRQRRLICVNLREADVGVRVDGCLLGTSPTPLM